MKTLVRLFILCMFSLSAAMLVSCAKESVAPYVPSDGSGGASHAQDIEYAPPQYSDEVGPSEESLDSQRRPFGIGSRDSSLVNLRIHSWHVDPFRMTLVTFVNYRSWASEISR